MNKKTIIAGIIISVFLIGIVSAGLVGYLSNIVTATVEVTGPVFYANSEKIDLFGWNHNNPIVNSVTVPANNNVDFVIVNNFPQMLVPNTYTITTTVNTA